MSLFLKNLPKSFFRAFVSSRPIFDKATSLFSSISTPHSTKLPIYSIGRSHARTICYSSNDDKRKQFLKKFHLSGKRSYSKKVKKSAKSSAKQKKISSGSVECTVEDGAIECSIDCGKLSEGLSQKEDFIKQKNVLMSKKLIPKYKKQTSQSQRCDVKALTGTWVSKKCIKFDFSAGKKASKRDDDTKPYRLEDEHKNKHCTKTSSKELARKISREKKETSCRSKVEVKKKASSGGSKFKQIKKKPPCESKTEVKKKESTCKSKTEVKKKESVCQSQAEVKEKESVCESKTEEKKEIPCSESADTGKVDQSPMLLCVNQCKISGKQKTEKEYLNPCLEGDEKNKVDQSPMLQCVNKCKISEVKKKEVTCDTKNKVDQSPMMLSVEQCKKGTKKKSKPSTKKKTCKAAKQKKPVKDDKQEASCKPCSSKTEEGKKVKSIAKKRTKSPKKAERKEKDSCPKKQSEAHCAQVESQKNDEQSCEDQKSQEMIARLKEELEECRKQKARERLEEAKKCLPEMKLDTKLPKIKEPEKDVIAGSKNFIKTVCDGIFSHDKKSPGKSKSTPVVKTKKAGTVVKPSKSADHKIGIPSYCIVKKEQKKKEKRKEAKPKVCESDTANQKKATTPCKSTKLKTEKKELPCGAKQIKSESKPVCKKSEKKQERKKKATPCESKKEPKKKSSCESRKEPKKKSSCESKKGPEKKKLVCGQESVKTEKKKSCGTCSTKKKKSTTKKSSKTKTSPPCGDVKKVCKALSDPCKRVEKKKSSECKKEDIGPPDQSPLMQCIALCRKKKKANAPQQGKGVPPRDKRDCTNDEKVFKKLVNFDECKEEIRNFDECKEEIKNFVPCKYENIKPGIRNECLSEDYKIFIPCKYEVIKPAIRKAEDCASDDGEVYKKVMSNECGDAGKALKVEVDCMKCPKFKNPCEERCEVKKMDSCSKTEEEKSKDELLITGKTKEILDISKSEETKINSKSSKQKLKKVVCSKPEIKFQYLLKFDNCKYSNKNEENFNKTKNIILTEKKRILSSKQGDSETKNSLPLLRMKSPIIKTKDCIIGLRSQFSEKSNNGSCKNEEEEISCSEFENKNKENENDTCEEHTDEIKIFVPCKYEDIKPGIRKVEANESNKPSDYCESYLRIRKDVKDKKGGITKEGQNKDPCESYLRIRKSVKPGNKKGEGNEEEEESGYRVFKSCAKVCPKFRNPCPDFQNEDKDITCSEFQNKDNKMEDDTCEEHKDEIKIFVPCKYEDIKPGIRKIEMNLNGFENIKLFVPCKYEDIKPGIRKVEPDTNESDIDCKHKDNKQEKRKEKSKSFVSCKKRQTQNEKIVKTVRICPKFRNPCPDFNKKEDQCKDATTKKEDQCEDTTKKKDQCENTTKEKEDQPKDSVKIPGQKEAQKINIKAANTSLVISTYDKHCSSSSVKNEDIRKMIEQLKKDVEECKLMCKESSHSSPNLSQKLPIKCHSSPKLDLPLPQFIQCKDFVGGLKELFNSICQVFCPGKKTTNVPKKSQSVGNMKKQSKKDLEKVKSSEKKGKTPQKKTSGWGFSKNNIDKKDKKSKSVPAISKAEKKKPSKKSTSELKVGLMPDYCLKPAKKAKKKKVAKKESKKDLKSKKSGKCKSESDLAKDRIKDKCLKKTGSLDCKLDLKPQHCDKQNKKKTKEDKSVERKTCNKKESSSKVQKKGKSPKIIGTPDCNFDLNPDYCNKSKKKEEKKDSSIERQTCNKKKKQLSSNAEQDCKNQKSKKIEPCVFEEIKPKNLKIQNKDQKCRPCTKRRISKEILKEKKIDPCKKEKSTDATTTEEKNAKRKCKLFGKSKSDPCLPKTKSEKCIRKSKSCESKIQQKEVCKNKTNTKKIDNKKCQKKGPIEDMCRADIRSKQPPDQSPIMESVKYCKQKKQEEEKLALKEKESCVKKLVKFYEKKNECDKPPPVKKEPKKLHPCKFMSEKCTKEKNIAPCENKEIKSSPVESKKCTKELKKKFEDLRNKEDPCKMLSKEKSSSAKKDNNCLKKSKPSDICEKKNKETSEKKYSEFVDPCSLSQDDEKLRKDSKICKFSTTKKNENKEHQEQKTKCGVLTAKQDKKNDFGSSKCPKFRFPASSLCKKENPCQEKKKEKSSTKLVQPCSSDIKENCKNSNDADCKTKHSKENKKTEKLVLVESKGKLVICNYKTKECRKDTKNAVKQNIPCKDKLVTCNYKAKESKKDGKDKEKSEIKQFVPCKYEEIKSALRGQIKKEKSVDSKCTENVKIVPKSEDSCKAKKKVACNDERFGSKEDPCKKITKNKCSDEKDTDASKEDCPKFIDPCSSEHNTDSKDSNCSKKMDKRDIKCKSTEKTTMQDDPCLRDNKTSNKCEEEEKDNCTSIDPCSSEHSKDDENSKPKSSKKEDTCKNDFRRTYSKGINYFSGFSNSNNKDQNLCNNNCVKELKTSHTTYQKNNIVSGQICSKTSPDYFNYYLKIHKNGNNKT